MYIAPKCTNGSRASESQHEPGGGPQSEPVRSGSEDFSCANDAAVDDRNAQRAAVLRQFAEHGCERHGGPC